MRGIFRPRRAERVAGVAGLSLFGRSGYRPAAVNQEASAGGELEAGAIVAGRYRVCRRLGKGGMGVVYAAEHIELGKTIALKMLLPAYSENAEVVARFLREARSAAAVGHPGIVEVFDLGRDGNHAFLAMELLEGEELHDRIVRARPLAPGWVARVGVEICEAMGAAHARGVIHRDLKPQNVFLVRRPGDVETVKVLDFGIAKLVDSDQPGSALTKTGQIFGTPLYMSLEQMSGNKTVDARTDVYAIGAMLYEALSGDPPFAAESFMALVLMVTTQEPKPLDSLRSDLPPGLAGIVTRAMAKHVDDRFASADELAAALRPFADASARPSASSHALDATAVAMSAPVLSASALPARSQAGNRATGELSSTTGAPITLRDAPVERRTGTPKLAAGVALFAVVVGLAGAAVWSATRPAPEPAAPREATLAGQPPVLAPSAPSLAAVAAGARPSNLAPQAPDASAAPQRVHVEIEPPGAEVRAADRWCNAPCDLELTGARVALEVRMPGFVTLHRELASPYPASVLFALERQRRRVSPGTGNAGDAPPALVPR
jgi:serine/threonine-protein kinase